MAKKQTKASKQEQLQHQKEAVDNFARILQIVAIVAVVAIIVTGQLVKDENPVPIWIPAGLMGVAIGLSPDQFIELIKAFLTGRKK
jgi:hypothetical protein